MTSNTNPDLTAHVNKSTTAWTCIPLPPDITSIPDKPFSGMSISTLIKAPPHLLAHIIRTKASRGVQVISPRAVPMLATIERIDPTVRQPDHIVVTTQASANRSWPTMDGRDLESKFPNEVNRCNGANAPQVTRTKTRSIGKSLAKNSASDPISKAIVRAASVIDMQRRSDVGGDADCLAEVLDVAWGLPMGTFATLAPLVLASSENLLRTAISTDHNAPDSLMSIQRKKVIHVAGGVISRSAYGPDVAMDWGRQRAVARSIFNLSTQLEGMNLIPNARVWSAADYMAPIHTTERDKHLVFQPAYGSGLVIDPSTFRFSKPADPPPRFAKCFGLNPPNAVISAEELDNVLDKLLASGLPLVAAETVKETFRLNRVTTLVIGNPDAPTVRVRGSTVGALHNPKGTSLALAHTEVTSNLRSKLARGAQPAKVIRSRIYDVMESVDAASLAPIFRTMAVMKAERTVFDLGPKPYPLIRQLAARLSHTLGALVVKSLGLEAARVGEDLGTWLGIANEVVPKPLRAEEGTTLGWAIVAIWSMWAGTTKKWAGALRVASHSTMSKMASATMRASFMQVTLADEDPITRAAQIALSKCKELYAPYYESMYDYYALIAKNSPELVSLGVGGASLPFRISADRVRNTIGAYLGALLWQLRGRHLRSARIAKIPLGAKHEVGMERRVNCVDFELAIMVAPNKAYESTRMAFEKIVPDMTARVLPAGRTGDVRDMIRALPEPILPDTEFLCDSKFKTTRLARYVMSPTRWVADLEKTYDEIVLEVAHAALNVGMAQIVPKVEAKTTALVTETTAAVAPVTVVHALRVEKEKTVEAKPGEEVVAVMSSAMAAQPQVKGSDSTGWKYMKKVYGDAMSDMILDMEDEADEDVVDALLNEEYETEKDFKAALDIFYGEDVGDDDSGSGDAATSALAF